MKQNRKFNIEIKDPGIAILLKTGDVKPIADVALKCAIEI